MEANWTAVVFLTIFTGVAVYIGRVWFKRWFNPLSFYSAIWGFCLCNYELRLIQYENISSEAWTYIFIAWLGLYLGAAIVILLSNRRNLSISSSGSDGLQRLRSGLVLCLVLAGIGLADQLRFVTHEFGNLITAIMVNAGDIYRMKEAGDLSVVPYVGAFSLPACCLAGIYTARVGRLTFLGVSPLVIVALQDLFAQSRLELGMAAVLFMACYVHTPGKAKIKFTKWQRNLALALGFVILGGGFIVVSAVRGLGVDFPGITPAMDRISEFVPVFPSIYSNFSATPVAFSMYLSSPAESKHGSWGEYSFAPVLRLLAKVGLGHGTERYEESYYTPVPMNTSSYLKSVHSDFGPVGVMLFPFLLSLAMTALLFRAERNGSLCSVVLLGNLYVIVVFSFAFNLMMMGAWYVSVVFGTLIAIMIDLPNAARRNVRDLEVVGRGNAFPA